MAEYIPDSQLILNNGAPLLPQPDIDDFWLRLGRETCNLDKWSVNCLSIMFKSYGTSDARNKPFQMSNAFSKLKCVLDDFVCQYYPANTWEINGAKLTQVFYGNATIDEYHVMPTEGKKYKKSLSDEERQYMEAFVSRLDDYIDYLENTIGMIPYSQHIQHGLWSRYMRNTATYVNKLKNNHAKIEQCLAGL